MVPRRLAASTVLLALAVMLVAGLLLKAPCTSGTWGDGRPYSRFCYSDVVALYELRGFAERELPYLERANEYPVLTGAMQWLTSFAADSDGGYLVANAALLAGLAVLVTAVLLRVTGDRALFFAAAPSLALTAFLNWDLLPVALVGVAVAAYLSRRDAAAGVMLGLGAAAKVYPALLVVPLVLGRLRAGERERALRLAGSAAFAWLAVNLPVLLVAPDRWSLFLRFNADRPVDWGTVWFVGCHAATGRLTCPAGGAVNTLSWVALLVGAVVVWRAKVARDPGFARWTFGLPLLVLLLLTAKVYSPQYTLWLLPWFALALPNVRVFVALSLTDAAVFFTEFSWLGRHFGFGGLPSWPMELAVVARAAVLVCCVVAWVRAGAPAVDVPVVDAGAPGATAAEPRFVRT